MVYIERTAFDRFWDRLLELRNKEEKPVVKSYGDLAKLLKIGNQAVSGAKGRGEVPDGWLQTLNFRFKKSVGWLRGFDDDSFPSDEKLQLLEENRGLRILVEQLQLDPQKKTGTS